MERVERKIHELDANGRILGRLATEVATLLRGKHKVSFTPHIDGGDRVVVTNVDKMKFSADKATTKLYRHYSGYPGGLKEMDLQTLMAKDPAEVLRRAVLHMLPDNRLRKDMMKRLSFK